MRDKEMIKEMAKDLYYIQYMLKFNDPYMLSVKGWSEVSEELLKLGWGKLPEDSDEVKQEFERRYENKVILDKEEYNKVDNIFKMSISDHIAYLRENERLKEDVQALIGMRFERFNLTTKEESDKQVQQASKETAEKFANEVYKELYQLGRIYALPETLDADKYGIFSITQEIVARIAKEQFDIEIKE